MKNMIAGGHESVAATIAAYKDAYPTCKKDETARTASYRLLQDRTIWEAIDKGLAEKEEIVKKARQRQIEKMAAEQVISEVQIDAKLSSIVIGQHKTKRKVAAFDKDSLSWYTETIEEEADEKTIVKAADLLYKRKGSYADTKIKHEPSDAFIAALQVISSRKDTGDV